MAESDILKELSKAYGKNIFKSANSIIEKERKIIPLAPRLNAALGGGLVEGGLIIFSGPEKFGKTTLALHAAAKAQKLYKKKVWYIDIECRLKKMNLAGIKDLDTSPENFIVVQSEEGNIITAEKFLDIIRKLIYSEPGCLIIIDSSSALCSEKEMTEDSSGQTRSLSPKLFANFCRTTGNAIIVNGVTVIVIQHLINDTSGKGGGKLEDGGVALQYQQDIKLRGAYKEAWKVGSGENEKIIGQTLHWKMMTGALEGNTPGVMVDTYLRYGTGIDELMDYIELASELSIIEKKGAWITIDKGLDTEIKLQGDEKLYNMLTTDHILRERIIRKVNEMTGMVG
jgi:recombination protein RecA